MQQDICINIIQGSQLDQKKFSKCLSLIIYLDTQIEKSISHAHMKIKRFIPYNYISIYSPPQIYFTETLLIEIIVTRFKIFVIRIEVKQKMCPINPDHHKIF